MWQLLATTKPRLPTFLSLHSIYMVSYYCSFAVLSYAVEPYNLNLE